MIVYDLCCDQGHGFEGWFGSSADFTSQREQGILTCPQCGSFDVIKAPMAPAVARKGNQAPAARPTLSKDAQDSQAAPQGTGSASSKQIANAPLPPEVAKAISKLAEAQSKALKDSKWVGKDFVNQSRAMHYGERDHQSIHGEASFEDAQELLDEGVAIAPLPMPVAPPDELN